MNKYLKLNWYSEYGQKNLMYIDLCRIKEIWIRICCTDPNHCLWDILSMMVRAKHPSGVRSWSQDKCNFCNQPFFALYFSVWKILQGFYSQSLLSLPPSLYLSFYLSLSLSSLYHSLWRVSYGGFRPCFIESFYL